MNRSSGRSERAAAGAARRASRSTRPRTATRPCRGCTRSHRPGTSASTARPMLAEIRAPLTLVKEVAEVPAPVSTAPARARRARPAAQGDGRRRRSRASRSVCSWLLRRRSSAVTRRSGRAGQAAVAVEAGADERLVGQVVAGEQRRDAIVEGGLGERSGGRQQAEHRPLHAIGEWCGGRLPVGRLGQPPAPGLDLGETPLVRAAELIADQREQALDGIGVPPRRSRPPDA